MTRSSYCVLRIAYRVSRIAYCVLRIAYLEALGTKSEVLNSIGHLIFVGRGGNFEFLRGLKNIDTL